MIVLLIIVAILAGVAAVAVFLVKGDNGVITNVEKMELNYAKTEVSESLQTVINSEKVKASNKITGTKNDISTEFNEIKLINYLTAQTGEEENPGINCLSKEEKAIEIKTVKEDGVIFDKYRVDAKVLSNEIEDYGKGKSISEGDVFTLEAITDEVTPEGAEPYQKSTGKFELKYYDENGNADLIETFDLYLTNQS